MSVAAANRVMNNSGRVAGQTQLPSISDPQPTLLMN